MGQRPVICVGAAVVDLVFQLDAIPRQPCKVVASSRARHNGGPAGTGAVACSRLGMPASFWGNVGQDEDGRQTRDALIRHGVETSGLRLLKNRPTVVAVVMVDPAGERMIVGHGAEIFGHPADGLPLEQLRDAGAVLADSAWLNGAIAVLEAADAIGLASVFDGEQSLPADTLRRCARLARYPVFCSEAFDKITGGAAPDTASLAALSAELGRNVGVTLGAAGSAWWVDGHFAQVPAIGVVCRDTTGAGDVFHGALAGAVAEAMPIERAIRFATAAAALKCAAGNGWDGMPDRAAVEQAMNRCA